MKERILSNWSFARIVRLGLGLMIVIQAVQLNDFFMGAMGLLFMGMAIFAIGCCSTSGCSKTIKKTNKNIEETTYEEVR